MKIEPHLLATYLLYSAIGIQLSQMPFMLLLARRLGVRQMLGALPQLGRAFVKLFATGIVLCVTGIAMLMLINLEETLETGLGHSLIAFLAGFSLYRLERQFAVGRIWPDDATKFAHWLLLVVHGSTTLLYGAAWQLAG
jgi:hypothetical protein